MERARASWALYAAIATRSFRRYSTYVGATISGAFTNSVFGVILSYAYLALWSQKPHAGGYDSADAITYVWLGQALLMPVGLFGAGSTSDLTDRVRSGDVAVDLYRPVNLVGWYLASDLGRATYHFLSRGIAPALVGALIFGLVVPTPAGAMAFLVSVVLAVTTCFAVRFLVAACSFWILDSNGINTLAMVASIFLSGMTLPLNVFPDGLRQVALVLPFAGMVQTPADLWIGRVSGTDAVLALLQQVAWALALLGCCGLVLRSATRRVVVQGG